MPSDQDVGRFDTPTIPEVVDTPRVADVFEVMTRAVFQAGVSWAQVAAHWNAYRRAFADFDIERIALYGEDDVARIVAETGVLRMPRKVHATIRNAAALRFVASEFGSFHSYVATFQNYAALERDMKKRFAFMGAMNVWYLLFRVGERVPRFESWVQTIPGVHPRMREMVALARSSGRSNEFDQPDS